MLEPRLKPFLLLILLIGVVLFLGRGATTWASSLTKPGRQTVPLTPPATWTPNIPAAPTAAVPPTRPPRADQSGTSGPYPILTLQADPQMLSPGQTSVISLALTNGGNAPLSGGVVTVTHSDLLRLARSRAAGGSVTLGPTEILWRLESVAPGGVATLELDLVLSEAAPPDRQLGVLGSLAWPGGEPLAADLTFTLPWALLPATGS